MHSVNLNKRDFRIGQILFGISVIILGLLISWNIIERIVNIFKEGIWGISITYTAKYVTLNTLKFLIPIIYGIWILLNLQSTVNEVFNKS